MHVVHGRAGDDSNGHERIKHRHDNTDHYCHPKRNDRANRGIPG